MGIHTGNTLTGNRVCELIRARVDAGNWSCGRELDAEKSMSMRLIASAQNVEKRRKVLIS